ncbi:MAG TPA: 50S ribosomal protein L25 [Atribacteraceae bacterium]|nr:50S ribosomal protein L25 [Atribacteraceae bacterium]
MAQKETTTIHLEPREENGKSAVRKMRRSGWIPGVLYSQTSGLEKALSVKIKTRELLGVMQVPGVTHHLLDLAMPDGVRKGIIKSVQRNPCKEEIWHIDFYGVRTDQKLTLTVPVIIKGYAEGVKMGGILEQISTQVLIECLPDAIPEGIEVDITALEIGDLVHVRDLTVPEGVEIKENADEVILLVAAPRAVVEEAVTLEEEGIVEPKRVGEEEEEV